MQSYIKNIIFDFDGTLVDTAPLIVKTMQEAMRQMNLPEKTEAECRATIGLRLEEIPALLWPGLPVVGTEYAQNYREIFDRLKRPLNVVCFPEVVETIKSLYVEGYRMAIASSRSHKSLAEYVDLFGLTDCFAMLIGGDNVAHGKPAPDPVNKILEAQTLDADETLVAGDAAVDILMGKAAGAITCAVTYGNGSMQELEAVMPDYIITRFSSLLSILRGVSGNLIRYVETEIIPRYAAFDKAHQQDHVSMVITQSMKLCGFEQDINPDVAYIIAAYHDLGLINGRENHHIDSRKILETDEFVKRHFTPGQIQIMGEAIEDHRASKSGKPRNRYGLIVAEADRFIDAETIIRRTIQYGLKNYPSLDREGHYNRTIEHLNKKYGPEGYLKVWLPYSDNAQRLDDLRKIIADTDALRKLFGRIFEEELK